MFLKIKYKALIFIYLLLFSPLLHAEILEVFVSWNSYSCDQKCAEMIRNKFENMKQVESVNFNPSAGNIRLKWNPTSPFSYQIIKTQLQMVGVGLNELRVRARGRGVQAGKSVVLVSSGDNTRFTLISPLKARPEEYIALPDGSNLELAPSLQEKVLTAAAEDKVIVVEGPIYQGHRSPPLYLITSRLQIEKKKTRQ